MSQSPEARRAAGGRQSAADLTAPASAGHAFGYTPPPESGRPQSRSRLFSASACRILTPAPNDKPITEIQAGPMIGCRASDLLLPV